VFETIQPSAAAEEFIGDAGVLNFFINREKLKNKDFTEILYNWDCY